VPASVTADPFLPDRLRGVLGLIDNARRYARDAYALCAMRTGREHLSLIVGRRSADGEPAAPSRLVLADAPQRIARRIARLTGQADRVRQPVALASLGARKPSVFSAERWPPPPDVDGMQPPEHLPVTAFRDYLACPYRFYLKHVLRLSAIDDAATEMDPATFGSLAHHVLDALGKRALAGEIDLTDATAVRRFLLGRLNGRFDEVFGGQPLPSLLIQREQLRRRLVEFADWQADRARDGWRIERCEMQVRGAELIVDGRAFGISGRIDRVDFNEEKGQRLILDYKTGDSGSDPEKTHRRGPRGDKRWVDLQLPLYRVLAAAEGIPHVTDVGYIVLPKQHRGVAECLAGWAPDELAEAEQAAADVVRRIRNCVFYPPAEGVDFDDYAAICGVEQYIGPGATRGGEA
jgi:hypothetical protein